MARKKTATPVSKEQVMSAAVIACEMLEDAYKNGEANEQMDWNDVDAANDQATHALDLYRRWKKQVMPRRKPS